MNITYVIADLHGAYSLLEYALDKISRHASKARRGSRMVVFLGDYVGQGPGSRYVVDRLMQGPPDGWGWKCLLGDHEDLMVDAAQEKIDLGTWTEDADYNTTLPCERGDHCACQVTVSPSHLRWVEALAPIAIDRHRVFVHAGVHPGLPLDFQSEQHLLGSRQRNTLGHGDRFVVHGHIPHENGPVRDGQSINLDTLAWKTGRLVVGVFDDDRAGGPIEFIEVTRPAR